MQDIARAAEDAVDFNQFLLIHHGLAFIKVRSWRSCMDEQFSRDIAAQLKIVATRNIRDLETVEDTDDRLVLRLRVTNGSASILSIGIFFPLLTSDLIFATLSMVLHVSILNTAVLFCSIACIPLLLTWGILRKRYVTFTLDGKAGEFIVDRTPFKESCARPVRDFIKFEAANDGRYSYVGRYGRQPCDPSYYIEVTVRDEASSAREIVPFTQGISKPLVETIATRLDAMLRKWIRESPGE